MQETTPDAEYTLLARHGEPATAEYATGQDDEHWTPLHCTLFITGSAFACWGVLIAFATLVFG